MVNMDSEKEEHVKVNSGKRNWVYGIVIYSDREITKFLGEVSSFLNMLNMWCERIIQVETCKSGVQKSWVKIYVGIKGI
jgi:hypothetical protein